MLRKVGFIRTFATRAFLLVLIALVFVCEFNRDALCALHCRYLSQTQGCCGHRTPAHEGSCCKALGPAHAAQAAESIQSWSPDLPIAGLACGPGPRSLTLDGAAIAAVDGPAPPPSANSFRVLRI